MTARRLHPIMVNALKFPREQAAAVCIVNGGEVYRDGILPVIQFNGRRFINGCLQRSTFLAHFHRLVCHLEITEIKTTLRFYMNNLMGIETHDAVM